VKHLDIPHICQNCKGQAGMRHTFREPCIFDILSNFRPLSTCCDPSSRASEPCCAVCGDTFLAGGYRKTYGTPYHMVKPRYIYVYFLLPGDKPLHLATHWIAPPTMNYDEPFF
jgi:hypothetical protein